MAKPNDDEICKCFDGICTSNDDRSTEFLLQMTADSMKCSYARVVNALGNRAEKKSKANGR